MVYVGIDPSYSRTGVVYFDSSKKKITFKAISPEGSNETYLAAANRAAYIASSIVRDLSDKEDVFIIFEEPLLNSIKASRLGLLSGILALSLVFTPSVRSIYTLTPSIVASMNRNIPNKEKLDKKKISSMVVESMLEYMGSKGFKIEVLNDKFKKDGTMKERKMSHDEAEAFLILLHLLKELGELTDEIWLGLMKIHKGLAKKYKINVLKEDNIKGENNEQEK